MKSRRKRAPGSLPVGALMAQVLVVVAVVLVVVVFQQQALNDERAAEVSSRQAELDRLEASLDQRRSSLDARERALNDRDQALSSEQAALERERVALSDADERLTARERALEDERAALEADKAELDAERRAFDERKADYDASLDDYAALQKAVDDALGARGRIAARIKAALSAAQVQAFVGESGEVSVAPGALFNQNSASLSKNGERMLDILLPIWYGATSEESVSALSVEVESAQATPQAMDLATRRASAILAYARTCDALGEAGRSAVAARGLSGARAASGEPRVVFRVYLNNDALRSARAG